MTDQAIAGTAEPLDPRRNAYRTDLASHMLIGKVKAKRFVEGEPGQIVRATVPLRKVPDPARGLETEALFGETLSILDEADGWAWVQLHRDGYVGYLPADTVTRGINEPTHRVQTLGTFIYAAPDIKTPPLTHLPLNAVVQVKTSGDRFSEFVSGGFVISRHLASFDRPARDFVEIAERFIGSPYLWGGRTRIGIDCSGLVQTSFQAAGTACPRDSDMQQAEVGEAIPIPEDLEGLERGDLVFWKGHVGIMTDGILMVHANAHHMVVAVEPLTEAAKRIARDNGEILAIKRPRGMAV